MRKLLLKTTGVLLLMLFVGNAWGQILTFDFGSLAGDEATAPSNSNNTNLTSSTISRGAGLTASSNAKRFNAKHWALTDIPNAVSGNNYMEFTITPNNGYQFSVSAIYIQMQRSSTGPRGIALRSSIDNYASNLDQEYPIIDNTSTQNFTFTFTQANSSSAVTYRIYMWAESTGGSGGIGDGAGNDIVVSGTTSSTGANIPTITLSKSTLSGFSYIDGSGPSTEQTFTVEGSNLSNNITLTAPTNYEISKTSNSGYTSPITLTQTGGTVTNTTIYARLKVGLAAGSYNGEVITTSSTGATDKTVTCSGNVYKTTPSNHVNSFTATGSGSTTINLSWAENDGSVVPDGYLIKASTGTIANPSNGTDPTNDINLTDGSGNMEVAHGTTSYSFTNCSSTTTYNFKIYPYTNSGSHIVFKTDGTVPSASATTGAPAAEPVLGDLKISEVNSTSAAYASYAEIYNTTGQELSLDKVDLEFYNDGSATASSTLHLTGTINPNSYIVIARKSADFNTAYGFSPDFTFNGMSINGGADGLILRHDNNGILDHFNDAPSPTVSWTDNHLFYRFDYASDGSSLANDWDDAGLNKHGTPKAANQLTWKTSGTTDWHTGSNWSNGDVPSKGVDVIIPSGGNQASVSGTVANPASCKNLTINSNAVLTIPVSKYMTVYGNLTNNNGSAAGLVVQSTSAGNGSLIVDGTITGNATVQRYIAKFSSVGAATGWHEIGCPVSSFSVSGTDWDPTHTGTSDDLYYWDESQNLWMNYRASTFNFSKGNGYLAANDANLTHVFTGVLNNTDVTISGLSYTSGKGNGWHLLGNPFPSAIKWNDGNWTLTNVGALAEIWNGTSASYTTISANGIIPSTNGFFVEVTSGTTGTVTIPASARTHYATNNNKSALATKPKETLTFKITDDANSYSDKSTVGFRPEATKNWDVAFDAHKILSFVKESPQIWTVSDGQKFLVNYLPEITSSYDVPLHFRAGINTVYHLTIKGADSFENTSLVLEDLQTGQKIDLSQVTSYDFTADKGDDTNRFVLHINGITAVPNVNKTDGIQVFAFGNTVYLHGQQSLNGRVSIFNTLGQQVYEGVLNGAAKQQIRLNQRQGIYFVRLEENNHVLTRKVFIK